MTADRASVLSMRPSIDWTMRVISWFSWGSLVVFTLVTIGLPLLGVGTFLGTDLLQRFAPWQSAGASTHIGSNAMIGDTIDAVVPQMWAIVEAARHGIFAEWTPFQAGGSELGGLPNSGLYSPVALGWWFVPLSYAPGLTKLLEVAVATLGMSLFLRRLGLPHPTWALGSLIFVSSGFMVTWTNWPQTRVAAFIPLLFWALDRAAVRKRLLDAIPVGIALACMLLGGFPAIVGYALYAGALYVLVRAVHVHRRFWRVIGAGAVGLLGVVVGFLLSAWTMLPFALNAISVLDFSGRRQGPGDHLSANDSLSAVLPGLVGQVSTGATWGLDSPVERFSYLGVATLVLLVVAVVARPFLRGRRTVIGFFVVAGLLSVVLVYGGGPILGALQQLPVFDSNRIGRLRVMIGFFAAILAAIGFARLLGSNPGPAPHSMEAAVSPIRARRWIWSGLVAFLGLAATVLLVLAVRRAIALAPEEFVADLTWQAALAAILAVGAAIAVGAALISRRPPIRAIALVAVPMLVAVPAVFVADLWWPKSDLSTLYPETPTTAFLEDHLGDSRYSSVNQTMLPGTNSVYRLSSLGGHTFQTVEWKSLLLRVDPNAMQSPTYSTLSFPGLASSIDSPILDRLAVKYIVMDPNLPVPGVFEPAAAAATTVPVGNGLSALSSVHTGPVLSVAFDVEDGVVDADDGATITASLVDTRTGDTLTSTSTWYPTISGQRNVALEGGNLPADLSWQLKISIDHGHGGITASADDAAFAAMSLNRPGGGGLQVVHAGDATVIERSSALDRVRWASSAVVVADPSRRVDLMDDPILPVTTVLLEHSEDAPATPSVSGSVPPTASVTVRDRGWDVNRTVVDVTAGEDGWVVFADSLRRPGWSVSIDGRPAELVDAEQAGGAVRVTAGDHRVELLYRTPGLSTGVMISSVTLGLVVLAYVAAFTTRRVRRSRDARRVDDSAAEVDAQHRA